MFRELFLTKIYEDHFINSFLSDIKLIMNNKETKETLQIIEKGLDEECNEMSRFSKFLTDYIQGLVEFSENEEYSDNDPSYIFNKETTTNKKEKFRDIEDWIQYIVADEERPKKSKKKNNKKKVKAQIKHNENNAYIVDTEDPEFEQFKSVINKTSSKAYNVNKLKTKFTNEWIDSICNNAKQY